MQTTQTLHAWTTFHPAPDNLEIDAGMVSAAAGILATCFGDEGFDHRSGVLGKGLHLSLGPSSHVQGRLLWQQRFLTILLDELHAALQASLRSRYGLAQLCAEFCSLSPNGPCKSSACEQLTHNMSVTEIARFG